MDIRANSESNPSADLLSEEPEESPELITTIIDMGRLDVPEDEQDILAVVHRLPGVERVWMDVDDLVVIHDEHVCSREDMVDALNRRGFYPR